MTTGQELHAAAAQGRWDPLYAFTTENIGGYLRTLGTVGPRVLTVAASGDHLLNAALLGGRDFELFDVNSRTAWWTELKLAALRVLPFDEFRTFFLREADGGGRLNRAALDVALFQRLLPRLSQGCRSFFLEQYRAAEGDGAALRNGPLFNNRYDSNARKETANLYLDDRRAYDTLKELVPHLRWRFRHCCVRSLAQAAASRRFDVILLSNIADYLPALFAEGPSPLRQFVAEVVAPLAGRLSERGQLAAAYVYGISGVDGAAARSEVDSADARASYFAPFGGRLRELSFAGVQPGTVDRLIMVGGAGELAEEEALKAGKDG